MSLTNPMYDRDPADAPPRMAALMIGQNHRGQWVVRDPRGMRGGIFANRAEAVRFATWEHGRPMMALLVATPVEFEMGGLTESSAGNV